MKTASLRIILVSILSLIPVLALFSGYYFRHKSMSYNFTRDKRIGIEAITRLDLKYNSYYIAGNIGNDIYLGNYTTPDQILKIAVNLVDTQIVKLNIDTRSLSAKGMYKVFIDSNNVYLFNGTTRLVLKGNLNSRIVEPMTINIPFFQESVPISNNSIAFKYVSATTRNNSLRKEMVSGKRIDNETALEKQLDGIFCTDGALTYNDRLKLLVYLYYYRNQIILMDTNLTVVRKLQTIDPIDSVKFTVSTIQSERSSVLTSPSLLVNAKCSSWNNHFFVQSKLMAKNDDETKFKGSAVIDVYDLDKGKYEYSLYLPNQDKQPIREFKVLNNYIYTLSDTHLNRYKLE